MKIYKPQRSFILGSSVALIFPIILTVLSFSGGGEVPVNEIKGLIGFWALFIVLVIFPLAGKIEVGDNFIQHYFFGFSKRKIFNHEVNSIQYQNVLFGGLGFGKGLKFYVKRGKKGFLHSIPEKMYGKEAIEHIQRVLSKES